MFVPVPIMIVVGLIVLLMGAQIIRLSRRRDPLSSGASPTFRPPPASDRRDLTAVPRATLPPEAEVRVRALIGAGRTIEAIKLVREVTHLGLKESKELVDAL